LSVGEKYHDLAKFQNGIAVSEEGAMMGLQNGSLPNNNSARMLDLDYGYSVVIKEKELDVNLPYFGRLFNPSYDTSKNSYNFNSKDFTVSKLQNKKGNWVFTVSPKDLSNVRVIYIEIFKNGGAYVSIDSNDRQAISYDGYIMKNEVEKETKK
jgi:hypothetical protein